MAYTSEKMNKIRDRLTCLLEQNGMSKNAMARAANINTSNFCRKLKKDSADNLTENNVRSVALAFNLNLQWLEDGVGEMFGAPPAIENMQMFDKVFKSNKDKSAKVTQSAGRTLADLDNTNKILMDQLESKNMEIERLNKRIDQLLAIIEKMK